MTISTASMAELASQQGVLPIRSVEDLVQPGMFDSDEELEEFLTDLYAERRRHVVSQETE